MYNFNIITEAILEIIPEYEEGLKGIDGFSHIIVIAHLHLSTPQGSLIIKPKGFTRIGLSIDELPEVGRFCTASPRRPNPIAVSIMKLVKRERNLLHVDDCDLYDGTPILDIKPFTPNRCPENVTIPQWLINLYNLAKERYGIDIFKVKVTDSGLSNKR
ncbi:tRNA (N6-threonylcarbamoyladenosine(37)-N6)-methyltransferase TrmO [Sulfolobus sp. A20-N-G8]|nr:tRNA (N6-threonylcarbamoyladenosine(37)-N6)-methyltransferase TrmO [Sulfolobus sp. A20-N-G8]